MLWDLETRRKQRERVHGAQVKEKEDTQPLTLSFLPSGPSPQEPPPQQLQLGWEFLPLFHAWPRLTVLTDTRPKLPHLAKTFLSLTSSTSPRM